MNIEIQGVHHANKGALLMLSAVSDKMRSALPESRLCLPLSFPKPERVALQLAAISRGRRLGAVLDTAISVLPAKVRDHFHLVPSRNVNVLLDISGFGYGDYWGLEKLRYRLSEPIRDWRRQGRRVILMPQALGPFNKPGMADAMRLVLSNADLVFARDESSLSHLEALGHDMRAVRLAPDFTNSLEPELPTRLSHLRGKALIIPNAKVTAGRPAIDADRYLRFLRQSVERLRLAGEEVAFLIHEGEGDLRLAQEANVGCSPLVPVIEEPDPLAMKALIGAASVVVSSRFHGLVSALSQGVPAVSMGWSYKYGELMRGYASEPFQASLDQPRRWAELLDGFINAARTPDFRDRLTKLSGQEKAKTAAMWEEVLSCIGRDAPALAGAA